MGALKKFIARGVPLFLGLILSATGCDSNFRSTTITTNPNASDPTTTVAQNVGPVAQLLTTDVLSKAEDIRSNLFNYVDDLLGNPDDNTFLRFINEDPEGQSYTESLDFSEDLQDCDTGGSRTTLGSATIDYNSGTNSGTIVGSFTLQYANCQDIILLETSNGSCSVTPTVDGELPVTITIAFTVNSNLKDYSQDVNDQSDFSATTITDLDVSVGSTASEQGYSFSYGFTANSSDDNFLGTASYENKLYEITILEDFIADTATTSICD